MPKDGTYADLASEYYDPIRHPTCANFREGSQALIARWLNELVKSDDDVLETGAGASLVAEWLEEEGQELSTLVIADSSKEMLRYSRRPSVPLKMLVCDSQRLPLASESFNIIVASLGDPYNTPEFWVEAARLLRPNGHVIFTTPSFDWADQFRDRAASAEFVLRDGRTISVPSFIESEERQREIIGLSGLVLIDVRSFQDTEIRSTPRSPKLRRGSIISAYLAAKKPRQKKRTSMGAVEMEEPQKC
jgi:SAM-dependent methyltransferase